MKIFTFSLNSSSLQDRSKGKLHTSKKMTIRQRISTKWLVKYRFYILPLINITQLYGYELNTTITSSKTPVADSSVQWDPLPSLL